MTLKEWFNDSNENKQAVYDAKNGRRYVYYRNSKSKLLNKLIVEEVVELNDGSGFGAWVY